MSEFGFLGFALPDEVNPVEAAQKKATAVEKINEELETRGIVAFALNADSIPEVEQRLLMREVDNQINEIVATYLPEDDDAKRRVVSNIFKKFEAAQYRGDPHWIEAKYPGTDAKGRSFKKGDRVFYYPNDKTFLIGEEAEQAARDFAAAAEDEAFMSRASVQVESDEDDEDLITSEFEFVASEDMPMKDGKPAFLSDDDEDEDDEEDSEDEDEDEDEDEEDSEDDEDEDDEDDESDDDESEEDEDDSKGSKQSNRIIITEDSRGPIDPKTQFDLGGVRVDTVMTCPECKRKFDLMDEDQAGEWYYGHDCETE